MSTRPKEMPKAYDFAATEQRLYQWWEENGWFKPEIAGPDAEPYVIAIPPPNVTGALHQGHALFVALEDLMIRHARMKGKAALWIPGTDHAGIATQLQVEKMLRDEGTSRQEIGREEFLRRTWQWKEQYGGRITQQLRRLGASCDWDRERFTLDEGLSRAVREAFVRWYEEGKIYRGTYMINWSPNLQTAVSDLEVERVEVEGKLYYFKYRLADGSGYIPVATTRPETILGDTAVAVHPEDERYQQYIGKTVLVPMLDREIPVIADEYVDREFGTGALKITPAHDPNDYEIGKKHNLPMINIMNKDATLNEAAGPYAGLDRFEAREKLWADMEQAGLTIKTEPYRHVVPIAQRGGELIEPMISTQWFADVSEPAKAALEAVRNGTIEIVPERFVKVWYHWLENIQPWCISRQLWWGHRIPAWYCQECGEITVAREDPTHCAHCNSTQLEQDPDVLDTWFSSGLWPFSTLGWPDETPDLERYYPTTMMETGYDILFFWVARMVMMGLSFTGQAPFRTVYLHGLVRDEHGQKMSKTKNNVIDPIEVMDEYGTDALRFTLLTGSSPGNDMNLSIDRIAANRNFANKIWNAARFLVTNLNGEEPTGQPPTEGLSLPDRWILSRLHRLIANVNRLFDSYQYGEAGRQIYDFLWGEYADWYIEIAKIALYGEDQQARRRTLHVLTYVLDQCLRLLHPYVPFVTEEIWQHIPHEGEALIIAKWPEADEAYYDDEAEDQMELVMNLIRGIRNIRAEYKVQPSRKIAVSIEAGEDAAMLDAHREMFKRLANVEASTMQIAARLDAQPEQAVSVTVDGVTAFLPLAGMVDLEAERERLRRELEDIEAQIRRSEQLLQNDGFRQNAPPHVVQREQDKLEDLNASRRALEERLAALA
ncbi:MAG: valine--tRNA ligase [Aggregatilineales bacterium]|nr:valine--tRNA ligase [Chloroflexota bacterium]